MGGRFKLPGLCTGRLVSLPTDPHSLTGRGQFPLVRAKGSAADWSRRCFPRPSGFFLVFFSGGRNLWFVGPVRPVPGLFRLCGTCSGLYHLFEATISAKIRQCWYKIAERQSRKNPDRVQKMNNTIATVKNETERSR